MMGLVEITDFLLARIADDEAVGMQGRTMLTGPAQLGHQLWSWGDSRLEIRRERVLAECQAKRRIVERFQFIAKGEGETTELAFHEQGLFEAVTILATVYADHRDYRDEWRP